MSSQTAYPIDAALAGPQFGPGRFFRAPARILEFVAVPTTLDASPPVLTPISPTPGSPVGPNTPIVAQIQDNVGFALREIWARFSSANQWELVYGLGAFVAPYTTSGIVTETGGGSYDRRTYTVRRSGGWPSNKTTVVLRFTVVDSSGNTLVLS